MVVIDIYEDITDELVPRVADQLTAAGGDDVTVHICSGGGSVFAGHAIVARLRDYAGRVTVVVDGLAASAASFIAVGGSDELVMSQGSELMIHEASMPAFGRASEFRKSADDLDRWTVAIAKVYAGKAGGDVERWLALMAAETWFTAEDAVTAGLADRVQSDPVPVAAMGAMNKIVAKYDFQGRGDPPPVELLTKEKAMSWQSLANELGLDVDTLKSSLTKLVKNEAVQISGEVEVTYPADLVIVPTEKIRVEPIIGDSSPETSEGEEPSVASPSNDAGEPRSAAVEMANGGISYEMGDVAEGFTAEVDASTGVVTIKAPSGAEVGSTAEFTVKANGADVPLAVKVRSLSDDDDEGEAGEESTAGEDTPPAPAGPSNTVSLDRGTYDLLVAQAKQGAQASADKARAERVAEVDGWIKDGRIPSSQRDKVLNIMHENPGLAREVYGSNSKDTVPMEELGHVGGGMPKNKADELLAKADSLRANNKKKGK